VFNVRFLLFWFGYEAGRRDLVVSTTVTMVTTATVITTLPIVTYKHWIEDDMVTRCSNLLNVGFLLMFKWLWSRAVWLCGFQQQSQWSLQPQWSQHSQLLHKHWIEDDLVTRCSNFFNVGFLLKLNGYDRREARLQWISTTATMLTTGTVVTTLPIVT
jgi:hypothetical protein